MRILAALLALALAGCERETPFNPIRCDFCKIERPDTRGFGCASCNGFHWSCPQEGPNREVGWQVVIKSCPPKEAR